MLAAWRGNRTLGIVEDSWPFDVSDARRASCEPGDVMRYVLDPTTWARWQPEIVDAAGPAPLAVGAVVRGRARLLGFHVQGHSTALAANGDSFEEDVIVGVRMRVRYEVEPADAGAVVTRRLRADLPRGPAGRLLSLFLAYRLRRMQRHVLEGLVRAGEAG